MLEVRVKGDEVAIGPDVRVTFQRTLRIPDDGHEYPLPPGLGAFPIERVADYAERVPAAWRERGGFFIPMYQREALWLQFRGPYWRPSALKVGIGGVDALTGEAWSEELHAEPQDYLVVPEQPWLDGINAGDGFVRQFVATPLGAGDTVEGQLTGREEVGGLQLAVFAPKPGRFPDRPPPQPEGVLHFMAGGMAVASAPVEMGLGAGGRMRQKIYPDEHGVETWDAANRAEVVVHIVNSEAYREITGREAPPTPVDARSYTAVGLPWFDLYDEHRRDLPASTRLAGVKGLAARRRERGEAADPEDAPVGVTGWQVKKLLPEADVERARGSD